MKKHSCWQLFAHIAKMSEFMHAKDKLW